MKFNIESKDEQGNIIFSGILNKTEAEFVLNIGVNFLMARGAMPLFTGHDEEAPVTIINEQSPIIQ